MNIVQIIANELNIKNYQVEKTIELIDGGNTIPFIARYRKEVTGGLSDEVLRNLDERLKYLRNLEERKEEVKTSIENQGKLTDEIVKNLEIAQTLAEVEDIYRPYKQKKKTRATVAKAKGLEPLAQIIKEQKETKPLEEIAKNYLNEKELIIDFGSKNYFLISRKNMHNEIIGESTQSNPLGNVVRTTVSFKSGDKVSDLISKISKAVQFHKDNYAGGENVTINEQDFINQLKNNGVTTKTINPSKNGEKSYEEIDKVPSTSFNITLSASANNQTATIQIPMVPEGASGRRIWQQSRGAG